MLSDVTKIRMSVTINLNSDARRCPQAMGSQKCGGGKRTYSFSTFCTDPGHFVKKVKQINRQSDLIWMRSFVARLTSHSDPLSTSI